MDRLTKDLAVELEPFGVTVENQAPFYVATKMSKIRRPRLDAPSPKTWVATGIRQIGYAIFLQRALLNHMSCRVTIDAVPCMGASPKAWLPCRLRTDLDRMCLVASQAEARSWAYAVAGTAREQRRTGSMPSWPASSARCLPASSMHIRCTNTRGSAACGTKSRSGPRRKPYECRVC